MTQVYIYQDRVYFLCQVKDLCKLIREYAGQYHTVQELIQLHCLNPGVLHEPN